MRTQGSMLFSDARIIYAKELRNLLKDRRTLFATLILPMVLLPVIFIGIGTVSSMQQENAAASTYRVVLEGNDDSRFLNLLSEQLNYELVDSQDESTLAIVFPQGYEPSQKAVVTLSYPSTSQSLGFAAGRIRQALSVYDNLLAEERLEAAGLSLKELYTIEVSTVDTAPEQARGSGFLAMMIPYMVLIYTFAGSMSVGMDTTAGEKERGSLALILVNQVSRTSIALGKVFYVLSVSIASSLMTFIGLLISFMIADPFSAGNAGFGGFSLLSMVILLLTLVLTSMLAASIIVFLGSLARSVKEASSYVMPVYIIVVVLGVLTMSLDASSRPLLFLIPFVNSVFLMKGAIIADATLVQFLFAAVSNLFVIGLLVLMTSKLYQSERILETSGS